jgi:hypothetical protein
MLQDFDSLVAANASTSLLTHPNNLGMKKTRAMAHWCEERGFHTNIWERKFNDNFKVNPDEPQLAVCGVDNRLARSVLEKVNFKRIIEAGLGTGTQEYLAFQLHSFPATRRAENIWSGAKKPHAKTNLQPAY